MSDTKAAKPGAPKQSKAPAASKGASKGDAKEKKPHHPRNVKLPGGVWLFSRSRMYHKRGLFKVNHAPGQKEKRQRKRTKIVKKIRGEKNGGTRVVRFKKARNYYPTEDKPKLKKTRKMKPSCLHPISLRKRITPGTVLILLAGVHRGKRVVFLKQLKTGLLLVTGPYTVNGCAMRRVHQTYVIATSTKIDISNVNVPEHLNDRYFRKPRHKKQRKDDGDIFESKPEEPVVSEQRKKDQMDVDKQVLKAIKAHPEKGMMLHYLASTFSLRNHMYPHKLKF
ncbi:large ribosomal subunit protein eL6-like [Ornithodoros turicata]|uniref:large ribosomal subunit protein eL6-like n=1 Tax=Ornithodoros turicata TaxID=34597 RepID=UPI003138CD6A